ncbi:DNA adenine methylase [Undibacterium sp. Xuan67W]|uniref:DNA adenine methylase n=1 Tax=Undibacterium sp. Xuan67W TaxID=3413057 RepID=UPI003BEF9670
MADQTISKMKEIKPFLKWAGGKRWLASKFPEFFPDTFNKYLEPFLGSGSIYFHLKPEIAILSDLNSELIETYSAIKNDWQKVFDHLVIHQRNHCKDYYYEVRGKNYESEFTRAAKLIYLNRTCWNGLYRVNLKGEFNVPIGTKNKVINAEESFFEIANLLQNAELINEDFESIVDRAITGDFLFVDPPYTVKHNYNGFVKYNENLFAWDDQIRLRDALIRAASRNVKILLTNACHESVIQLYEDFFQINIVERASVISGSNVGRGSYEEIIVQNL